MDHVPALDEWCEFASPLEMSELWALVGLFEGHHGTPLSPRDIVVRRLGLGPSAPEARDLVNEGKITRANLWARRHFRNVLAAYCDVNAALGPDLTIQKVSEKLAATVGIAAALQTNPSGVAAALSAWLLAASVQSWCDKYGPVTQHGPGLFILDVHDAGSLGSPLRIPGQVSVKRRPAIHETFASESYRLLPTHVGRIEAPEELDGWLTPDAPSDAARVNMGDGECTSRLEFTCKGKVWQWLSPDLQEQLAHPERVCFVGGRVAEVP